jgi:CHAT domain-containing protein
MLKQILRAQEAGRDHRDGAPRLAFIGRHGVALIAGALALLPVAAAAALSQEQAVERCRESVGRPIMQACMAGRGRAPDAEAIRAKCREQASPKVRACVQAALNAANGRANVALPMNKDGKPAEEAPAPGNALPAGFVPPPRTIADITAILDSEKPSDGLVARLNAAADNEPAKGLGNEELAEFYYQRSLARTSRGRTREALADGEKAAALARALGDNYFVQRIEGSNRALQNALGDMKAALQKALVMLKEANAAGNKGYMFGAYRVAAQMYVASGEVPAAEALLRRQLDLLREARTSGLPGWRNTYPNFGRNWESEVENARAVVFEARGQFREAEQAYAKARDWKLASIADFKTMKRVPTEAQQRSQADASLLDVARMKARQGRLAEAEVDARSALLNRLKAHGKYNPATPRFVMGLAAVLVEEGRFEEAEKLARASLDIQRQLGIGDDTYFSAQILSQLGAVLTLQRKQEDAAAVYAELDRAIAKWEPQRRAAMEMNGARIDAMLTSGQTEAALKAADALVRRETARVGETHFDTASARGILAMALAKAGRSAEAIREYKAALPVLLAAARENADDDDATLVAGRTQRLQGIVEGYIGLLATSQGGNADLAAETFSLADAVRGRSVQQALSASSARASVKDPELADLVRKEQDLAKQLGAQLGLLNNVLAMPSGERDEKAVRELNASIRKLRQDREQANAVISKRFPAYAELVDPKPPTVEQMRAVLADGEAMLSFYFGRDASFVWAVPKQGKVAFAAIQARPGAIESKVRKLRESLEPQAAMVSDIPAFDLALAHELYELLLKPVEAGWRPARSLVVVTNGALGLLPLSLLPTAPASVKADDEPLFADYRKVPWLARSHAVTMVPSSAALRTLRQLPPGKPTRSELIAFGDPVFSGEAPTEAAAAEVKLADAGAVATRGVPLRRRSSPKLDGVDSAELAMLPQLPDTADELRSIALALQADPTKALNLGKDANEQAVKTLDLSGFKVLAFATHGLVPGELNGLTQPALALSAPKVAGVPGDGLLTMEEILTLKLDADWVVLSACNTGAGEGAGAEAASGLGRAFFYAGTRALLVTNWSVHSQSAKELISDLFRRQAADATISRAEALRQAMTALMDGPGYVGKDGKTEFAYAHPLFWAPYSIIGDGGKR